MKWTAGIVALLVLSVAPAMAGPINFGVWYEFAFDLSQPEVLGCDAELCPELESGAMYASTPPWTFTAPATGANLTVTDVNLYGDSFEIFANSNSLGMTSTPVEIGNCGPSPVDCVDSGSEASKGTFFFMAGSHEFTINLVDTQFGQGTGYFRVDVAPIPEPGAMILMASGFAALLLRRRIFAKKTN